MKSFYRYFVCIIVVISLILRWIAS